MGKQNVIELNGKVYDAKTGTPLRSKSHSTHQPARGKTMDGFFGKRTHSVAHQPKPTSKPAAANHAKPLPSKSRAVAKHAPKRIIQKSKTLMRSSLSKPLAKKTVSKPTIERKDIGHHFRKAVHTPKSSLISRFGSGSPVKKTFAPLPITAPPVNSASSVPPAAVSHQAKNTAEAHFHKAMSQAQSHKNKKTHSKKRRHIAHQLGISARSFNIAAAVFSAVLLFGFFAYQNVPNISMQIAASRAGFSAKMPGYTPSNYSPDGPIEYSPGRISVSFKSHSDDRSFKIDQQTSSWNSAALAENYLTANNKSYQTYQDKGRTIFIFDDENATWVNGGVWYTINGNGVLNNDQLIRVANSL